MQGAAGVSDVGVVLALAVLAEVILNNKFFIMNTYNFVFEIGMFLRLPVHSLVYKVF